MYCQKYHKRDILKFLVYTSHTWVKYVIVLDSNTFLCFTELICQVYWNQWKKYRPGFLVLLHQARSVEHGKVFQSKTITYFTQV